MSPRTIPEHRRIEHERRRKVFDDERAAELAAWDEVFGGGKETGTGTGTG